MQAAVLLLLAPDAPAVSLGADADGGGAAGEPLGEDEQRKQVRSSCACLCFKQLVLSKGIERRRASAHVLGRLQPATYRPVLTAFVACARNIWACAGVSRLKSNGACDNPGWPCFE